MIYKLMQNHLSINFFHYFLEDNNYTC